MNEHPQEELKLTITNDKDTIEFIQHQDHNYWLYFNGVMTDTCYPRHENFNKNMKRFKLFKRLWYGKSNYNKTRITDFFKEIIPEEFL